MGRTATDVTFLQKEGISALAATALVRGLPCWGSGSQASKKETAPDGSKLGPPTLSSGRAWGLNPERLAKPAAGL